MKLPKRPKAHITEAASWKLLQSVAPNEWIVREVSERDYGIDCYIELCTKSGHISGDMFSVQLKGVNEVKWKNSSNYMVARTPSINVSTVNYWLNLPVPVFLFIADLSTNDIYYVSVEEEIRNQYQNLYKHDAISFKIAKDISLKSEIGKTLLPILYNKERNHDNFTFHVINLLSNLQLHIDFINANQGRDFFMEIEPEQHIQFKSLYKTCQMASIYLDNKWEIESLEKLYKQDTEEFKGQYAYLHEKTLSYTVQKIEELLPNLVRQSLNLITKKQYSFWLRKDPVFFNLCDNSEIEQLLSNLGCE